LKKANLRKEWQKDRTMEKWKFLCSVSMYLGVTSGVALAVDGSVNTTSTGTSGLSVTINEMVQVTDIQDPLLSTTYGTSGDLDANDDVCVWTNDTGDEYKVTATGSGTASAFTITDGTETIAYSVYWNDETGITGRTTLTTNVQTTAAQTGATNTYPCTVNNANLSVNIAQNAILSAQAGTYTGTLTVVLAPNT
jgi:hypothetical protein